MEAPGKSVKWGPPNGCPKRGGGIAPPNPSFAGRAGCFKKSLGHFQPASVVEVYGAIKAPSQIFTIQRFCEVLGVSRSAHYSYLKGRIYVLGDAKERIADGIEQVFHFHRHRCGWRRIRGGLSDKGIEAGRHQIRSRVQERGLMGIRPKSFVPVTTRGHPHLRRSENLLLLEENLPSAPVRVIVGDITYLPGQGAGWGEWLYIGGMDGFVFPPNFRLAGGTAYGRRIGHGCF